MEGGPPDHAAQALQTFLDRRAARKTPPSTATSSHPEFRSWMRQSSAAEVRHVVVKLQEPEQPAPLPKLRQRLFQDEPTLLPSSSSKSRILAIRVAEERPRRRFRARPLRSRRGGRRRCAAIFGAQWVRGPGDAGASSAKLAQDPRVLRIDSFAPGKPDQNNLDDMRSAAQVVQLHDAGADSETPSGRSAVGDMFLAIIDTDIDANHPAWNDAAAGSSRLTDIWRWNGTTSITVAASAVALSSHGTKVAGNAVGT